MNASMQTCSSCGITCSYCGKSQVDLLIDQRPSVEIDVQSGIDRLTLTNSLLHDAERTQIGSVLATHEYHQRRLASKRAELLEDLRKLEDEESRTLEQVSRMKLVLHPIRDLPTETLHEILSLVVNEVNYYEMPLGQVRKVKFTDIISKQHPLWVFSHVCSRWRNLLLSSPRMWSDVNLRLTQSMSSFPSSVLMRLFISRSNNLPLNITLLDDNSWIKSSHSLTELFLNRHRWSELVLGIKPVSLPALNYAETDFDLLECMHLAIHKPSSYRYDNEDLDQPFLGFMSAPKLHDISIETSLSDCQKYVSLPWHQLTDVNIKIATLAELVAVFPSMTQVESASLTVTGPEAPIESLLLESATLTTLELSYKGNVASLLRALRCPAVDWLLVCHHLEDVFRTVRRMDADYYLDHVAPEMEGSLEALTLPTGPGLNYLGITVLKGMTGLRELLESVPDLESLTVTLIGEESMDGVFEILRVEEGRNVLVPQLRRLTMGSPHMITASDMMNRMVESRLRDVGGVTKLESVMFDGAIGIEADVLEAFAAYDIVSGMIGKPS